MDKDQSQQENAEQETTDNINPDEQDDGDETLQELFPLPSPLPPKGRRAKWRWKMEMKMNYIARELDSILGPARGGPLKK